METKFQFKDAYNLASALYYNDGNVITRDKGDSTLNFKDIVTNHDLQPLLSQAISHVMLREIEPPSVVYNSFFREIKAQPESHQLIIHNIGPVEVENLGRHGEWPEKGLSLDRTGQEINLRTSRYGAELRVHQEVIKQNIIPIVNMWLERAINGHIRNREKLAIQELNKTGVVVFDNDNPANYDYKVKSYTGRGIDGVANGTMSLNDLMEVYVDAMLNGFIIDTIGMHPLAWQTFMTDPEMKEIVTRNNTLVSFKAPKGGYRSNGDFAKLANPYNLFAPWDKPTGNPGLSGSGTLDTPAGEIMSKMGLNPYSLDPNALSVEYNIPASSYFPTPLNIVVSPHFPFRRVNNTTVTDIVFAQSDEAGIVFREGDPIVQQFALNEQESLVVRASERLAFGSQNLGKAVRVAKNVVVDRNYVFSNVNQVSLSALDTTLSRGPYA